MMHHSTSPCSNNYTLTCGASQERRAAWAEFLNQWAWDWFGTFTFRGDFIHPESADKRFRVFVSKVNRALYGVRWYKKPGRAVRWARALETQKRGVVHYHALLGGVGLGELRRLTFMDTWAELAGWARIEPPRSSEAVRAYVSKYVVKDGEIDLGGPLARDGSPLLEFGQVVATPEPNGADQAEPGCPGGVVIPTLPGCSE